MVRNGGDLGAGVGRFEDVRCQVSCVMCQVSGVTKEIMTDLDRFLDRFKNQLLVSCR